MTSKNPRLVVATLLSLLLGAGNFGCGGSSPIPPNILVSLSPTSATVPSGTMTAIAATVAGDVSGKGVTWSVTCSATVCGSVSPTSTGSGVPTNYAAPAAAPASDLEVTLTAASATDPTKTAVATITVPAITVNIQPSSTPTNVPGNTTAQFTATVGNDPNSKGVTWIVSCSPAPCGSVAPTSTASGATTTYSAPPPPASDLTVSLTATSITDPNQSSSVSVTVPAILVSAISPNSGIIPINATPQFVANVSYDASNSGLSWSLTQNSTACSPACGTVSPATTASGASTTYTAPSTVPTNAAVTLNATSVADTTKSASAALTLTNGTVELTPASLSFRCKFAPRNHCPPPAQSITLTNTGTAALAITSVATTSVFSQTNTCGASVNPGSNCTITVTFLPKALGTVNGSVSFSDSSPDSPQQVALSGDAYRQGLANQAQERSDLAATTFAAIPRPTGPSAVGTQVLYLTDPTREDPYLANGTKRELSVRLWYPASANSARDCKAAEYATPAVWDYFAHLVGVPPFPVATNSCVNAPLADGVHPVVLFTPGYTATATDYTFLTEELASRGYVVASVNHTYEATAVELENGRLARSVVGSHLGGQVRRDGWSLSSSVVVRLQDLKFVLDEIERLNVKRGGEFAGKLDMAKIVIAGHSLGGLTAFLGAEFEPRLKAAIMLDGLVPDTFGSATRKPVLILAAGRQKWDAGECDLWKNLQGPRLAVNLRGTEHVALSDWIWLTKDAVQVGSMGPDRTMAAVRDYVAEFLDANLRNEPLPPLLTGPSSAYPDAVLTTQNQALCHEP